MNSIIQAQGIHHITLNGADKKTSIDFWQNILGMKFIFEQPNIFKVNKSLLFLIFNINHMLEIKIIKGKSFNKILGIIIEVKTIGFNILTLRFLKNSISSNKFKMTPKE